MRTEIASLSDGGEAQVHMDVNTTPLIAVMLVLLVTLVITVPARLHTVKLEMGEGLVVRLPVLHEVSIDFDGTLYWDGQALPNRTAVDAKMREVGAIALDDRPEIYVRPNNLADYGVFAAVMASAQRNGVTKMGIIERAQLFR